MVGICAMALVAPAAETFSVKANGWISGVAFSPDGRLLANACSDHTAQIRSAETGKEIAVLRGHRDCVTAVAFSPTRQILATASYDQTARLWDVASARMLLELRGHHGPVMAVAFSPDGKLIATAGLDTTIQLWNVRTGAFEGMLRGHLSWVNSIVFGPDGDVLLSGSSDGTVRIWNVRTGKVKATLRASDSEVRAVAVSPDGKTIVAGMRYGAIKMWFNQKERFTAPGHGGDAWSLAFLPDGKNFIYGEGDWHQPGQVHFRDAVSGELRASLRHPGEVLSVACSRGGKRVVAGGGDGMLTLWDVPKSGN